MKADQIESYQKCLPVKIYEWHEKKASRVDLLKNSWFGLLKIDACVAAKQNNFIMAETIGNVLELILKVLK